jgi:hypothetical protein
MKPSDLVTVWDAPDNTQLTAKQYTIRLPIRVAAQISALCDLYPKKNRTELIGDLLASALDAVSDALPYTQGPRIVAVDDNNEPIHETYGPRVDFPRLTSKYTKELETELTQVESVASSKPSPRKATGKDKSRKARGSAR